MQTIDHAESLCQAQKACFECNEKVAINNMAQKKHLRETCSYGMVPCPYQIIGCSKSIRFFNLCIPQIFDPAHQREHYMVQQMHKNPGA